MAEGCRGKTALSGVLCHGAVGTERNRWAHRARRRGGGHGDYSEAGQESARPAWKAGWAVFHVEQSPKRSRNGETDTTWLR